MVPDRNSKYIAILPDPSGSNSCIATITDVASAASSVRTTAQTLWIGSDADRVKKLPGADRWVDYGEASALAARLTTER